VIDIDATLVTAHSEKEQAAAPFKHATDSTRWRHGVTTRNEMLAVTLRPGNAGSNHAGDHIDVLGRAITQIPAAHRRRLLVRADGAGATHDLLDWLTAQNTIRGRGVEYSVGFSAKNPALTSAITAIPEAVWTPAIDAAGKPRDRADVAEVTDLSTLKG
jgi:hypothetical protein